MYTEGVQHGGLMHTLTMEWLIQSPSLWRESWNLGCLQQRMQCYELQIYSAHIMQLHAFWPASPHPPVLVWPLVAAWCWEGLVPESLWGWGPWGGHGPASAGPVSAGGPWRQGVQGPAQQQSSWGWPGPGGALHPPVHRQASPSSGAPRGCSWHRWWACLSGLFRNLLSHLCSRGLWSFTWMDPLASRKYFHVWMDDSEKGHALETLFLHLTDVTQPQPLLPSFSEIIFCFLSLDISPFFLLPFYSIKALLKQGREIPGHLTECYLGEDLSDTTSFSFYFFFYCDVRSK